MSSTDPLDFPPELCTRPAALIGLFGLRVTVNPLHRTIWDLFSKIHENSPGVFKLFETSHNFPPVKPKKSTYDWYTPRGLLKRNWMRKHLLEIPAVAVLFFDMNWDDSNIEELRAECVAELQALRNSLGSHATKIAIILIQKAVPLPDDSKASEKAKQLCAACEIDPKQLFVLPQGDHLPGYVGRLEKALYELAQYYYHHEIKQVKQHKDQLNKMTQQYLFVRHQFKLGFLSELKQDNHTAKKHYDFAYTYLRDVRMFDTNILEIKLVAGFINYKICYLMFLLNQPRDAINHLKAHIDFFKSKTGPQDLIFEHYSWLCKQYSAFGDIFDDAIRRGLSPVQTQHPGFYYRLAAMNAIERKKACLDLCVDVAAYPSSDPLQGFNNLEFFGQRPWRQGKLSAEPTNPAMESDGVTALKYNEKLVNHSEIIISLLGRAISQFKTYKCPRMRLQLVVQMAEEYYFSKDYGKALTLLSHILWDYRNEKWWLILSTLLSRALSCAYLSASVQDYVTFALEALGPSSTFDTDNRKRIFSNLSAVLKGKTPEPEPDVSPANASSAVKLWKVANSSESSPFTIEMSNMKSCIEAKARFTKSAFNVEEVIIVEIFIRCTCLYPIEFSNISVIVNSLNFSSEFSVSSEKYCLTFEPGVMKKLHCEFSCDIMDANRDLHVGYVLLTVGTPKGRSVVLKYSISNFGDGSAIEKNTLDFQYFRINSPDVDGFDQIENLGVARIAPKASNVKVQIKHNSPALVSEWYPIRVLIRNEEGYTLVKSSVEVRFAATTGDAVEQSTQLSSNVKTCPPATKLEIPVRDIPASDSEEVTFFLRGYGSGIRNLNVRVWYGRGAEHQNDGIFVDTLVNVPVIKPFDVSTEILSMKFEQIDKCFYKDPFILSPTVQILSPWPILIHNSSLELGLFVKSCDKDLESHLAGITLNEGEGGTDMFALRIDESSDQPIALGTYILQWSRVGSSELTSSSVTMPTVMCKPAVLGVEMSLPAHGWVRKPMTVEYRLCNNTSTLLELDLVMDASDAFMFAGQKQVLRKSLVWEKCLRNRLRNDWQYHVKPWYSTQTGLKEDDAEEVRIPVPWGHIAGKWWGRKDGIPMLGIHGWQDNAGSFDKIVPHLNVSNFLAIDLPGHGFSSHMPPGKVYTFPEYVYSIRRVIDYFKWKKYSILGHSLGSALGMTHAAIYKDEVEYLISLECARYLLLAYRDDFPKQIAKGLDKILEYDKIMQGDTPPGYTFPEAIKAFIAGSLGSITSHESASTLLKRGATKVKASEVSSTKKNKTTDLKVFLQHELSKTGSKSEVNEKVEDYEKLLKDIDKSPEMTDSGEYLYLFTKDPRVKMIQFGLLNMEIIKEISCNITCPVLAMQADQGFLRFGSEKLYKMGNDIMKKHSKHFEHHVVKGNHHFQLNNPENVAPVINSFLERIGVASP